MNITDIAYAAGVIDGEGHVGIHRHWYSSKRFGRYAVYNCAVSVTNTNEPVLQWLKELFGVGNVYPEGRKKPLKPHYKPRFVWILSAKQAAHVIAVLLPFLRIKKEEALLVLALDATMDKTLPHVKQRELAPVRNALYIKCRSYKAYCGRRP